MGESDISAVIADESVTGGGTAADVVSVIVPVYNVEQYLTECIDSIRAQTYVALEVILVDDGSTDSSGRLCDNFAAQDSRIRVIHQSNGGVASARNRGLDQATGEWVLFVDADDRLRSNLVERCMDALKRVHADIAVFQYQSVDENGEPHPYDGPLNQYTKEETLSGDDAIERALDGPIEYYPWCYIARRSLYGGTEPIRFPEGRAIEDEGTVYKPHALARAVVYLPLRLYEYRQRSVSRMHSSKAPELARAREQNAWEMYLFLRDRISSLSLRRTLLAKTIEMIISAQYGSLRAGAGSLTSAQTHLDMLMSDPDMQSNLLGLGLRVRAFAIRHHCDRTLAALERFTRRG
ncbi:glycosyltransferase family 2 protein [Bifidobacterium jacchi]|nr:glycosyltransferase family 2 protein [Bifidobacterium jacchi]